MLADVQKNGAGGGWGVVLLCHGSQRGASRDECSCAWAADGARFPAWCLGCPNTPVGLRQAGERLAESLGSDAEQVIVSCLEFLPPHPPEAVSILAQSGVNRVVIAPYLLGNGKHATLEMDEVLEDIAAETPGVELRLAQGLGADGRIADLVRDRIATLPEYASSPDGGRPTGIMLVKAGTQTRYDDCLWLKELGSWVERDLGEDYAVSVAQSHYGDPTMEFAAAELVEERGVGSIICAPYLFFPGLILQRNVLGTMNRLQQTYPDIPMSVAPPLGVDDRLVQVASDRVREAQAAG
jgi:sirohydrochlorin ferrochelatase